ncbi:hypothetical protein CROQUDRAFT_42225 [Cronartium quercuum f. sp. fusiforme G11]|uniref:Transcriptional adapter n=1 Tax=Cronartium quercuum f. sp. fusiforme G11 TaxID=708437 RepID=A0A9P6TD08_9BASI|nr:hypothetical protein CROQUDRAFT_42225 [Cronartium quercuum f. sp. fusiforme G11]
MRPSPVGGSTFSVTVTYTQRKKKRKENIAEIRTTDPRTNSDDTAGVKYTCDGCSADISHSVKIRCAHQQTVTNTVAGQVHTSQALVCENFDLCAQCFCEGKEVGRHKAWHDYRVVEQYSTPIFVDDWGADEELLVIDACQTYGLGNWSDIADHVGNGRTGEDVRKHYVEIYIGSDDYPLPPMDVRLDITQDEFQARKKQRLEKVQSLPLVPPKPKPLASGPSNHEIAGFMPGRLDFETEWENEAENSIKDLSFGRVYRFGGDSQPERAPDEEEEASEADIDSTTVEGLKTSLDGQTANDTSPVEVKKKRGLGSGAGKVTQRKDENVNPLETIEEDVGEDSNLDAAADLAVLESNIRSSSEDPLQLPSTSSQIKSKIKEKEEKKAEEAIEADEEVVPPVVDEDDEDLELKLAILDIYNEKYNKRLEAKAVVFDRNLLEYKKIQAAERKLPKEIRDLIIRIKPFARLQTALDHEKFQEGLISYDVVLDEMTLRKRIAELQEYRRMGITTLAEAERYEKEKQARIAAKHKEYLALDRLSVRKPRVSGSGTFYEDLNTTSREGTPGLSSRVYKRLPPLPLSLTTSSSQQLLHSSELALCSRLRILPKPFLYLKELLFREHVRMAAMGRTLKRSDLSNLVALTPTIDDDVLELESETKQEPDGASLEGGLGIVKMEDVQPEVELGGMKAKGKWTKLEAMWDFYFRSDDEEQKVDESNDLNGCPSSPPKSSQALIDLVS